jgi:ferritin-like protein
MYITDKHSLFGYDADSVEEVVNQAKQSFEQHITQLEDELKNIDKDIQKINDQLIEMRDMKPVELIDTSMQDRIAGALLDAHIKATQKIVDAQNEAEHIVQEKKAKIMFYQRKNEELKDTIQDLIGRLRSMV